jgi:hypothetical protein
MRYSISEHTAEYGDITTGIITAETRRDEARAGGYPGRAVREELHPR